MYVVKHGSQILFSAARTNCTFAHCIAEDSLALDDCNKFESAPQRNLANFNHANKLAPWIQLRHGSMAIVLLIFIDCDEPRRESNAMKEETLKGLALKKMICEGFHPFSLGLCGAWD